MSSIWRESTETMTPVWWAPRGETRLCCLFVDGDWRISRQYVGREDDAAQTPLSQGRCEGLRIGKKPQSLSGAQGGGGVA
jgi:hypothetical protein